MKVFLLCLFLSLVSYSLGTADSFEDFEAVFAEAPEEPVKEDVKDTPVESQENIKVDTVIGAEPFYDEEEFEGFEDPVIKPAPPAGRPVTHKEAPTINTGDSSKESSQHQPTSSSFDWKTKDWSVEISYTTIIALYLLNFFVGKHRNARIVQTWVDKTIELYKANFYFVGHGEKYIKQESSSIYSLTTTGRIHCGGSHTEIQLRKRHDLLALVYYALYPAKDTMTVTIPLNKEEMNPFAFAIVSSSSKNSFLKEHLDMENATQKSISGLPKNFYCFTDTAEAANTILSNRDVLSVIKENSDLIEWIYVTDIHQDYIHSNILQVRLNIPTKMDRLETLMKLCFYLIDFLTSIKLTKISLQHVEKLRKQLQRKLEKESNQQRRELSQAKKEEALKEKLAKMTPEELEKHKEKQEKKRMRKMMNKQTKKVVSIG